MPDLFSNSLANARRAGIEPKIYHRAAGIRADGAVTALCYSKPRKINLAIALWTNRDEAVTCPKCKALLGNSPSPKG